MQIKCNFFNIINALTMNSGQLLFFAEIGARQDVLPLCLLNAFSKVNWSFNEAVQWRIQILKNIRDKYEKRFSAAARRRLINHPFEYTSKRTKIIGIENMGFNDLGLSILDTEEPIFDPEFLNANVLAFTNVCFLTTQPINFVMFLMLGNFSVYSKEVCSQDYTDLGALSDVEKKHLEQKYNGNIVVYPGRYFIDLCLPTRINPITLGDHFIDHRAIRLCIADEYKISAINGELAADIKFEPNFIIKYFTHAFVHFNCVDAVAYDWEKYGLTFNGEINSHIYKFSLIRKKESVAIDPDFGRNNIRGMMLQAHQNLQAQLRAAGNPLMPNIDVMRPEDMANILQQLYRAAAIKMQAHYMQQDLQDDDILINTVNDGYPFVPVNILGSDDDNIDSGDISNDDDIIESWSASDE